MLLNKKYPSPPWEQKNAKGGFVYSAAHSSLSSFRMNVKNTVKPMREVVNNIMPIGTADASRMPASGVKIDPNNSGSMPKTALALPARCPCLAIPSVKVLVITIPIVIM